MRTTTIVVREVRGPSALTTVSRLGGAGGGVGLDMDRTFWAGRVWSGWARVQAQARVFGSVLQHIQGHFMDTLGFKIWIDISV